MLSKVMEFQSKRVSNGVVGSLQTEKSYPRLCNNVHEGKKWGLVRVSHQTPWNKIAGVL